MNHRITTLITMICVAVAVFGVYLVKYAVQDVQAEVAALEVELKQERTSLHLLNAEWAYLNRPERLRQLAEQHLELVPLDSRHIDNVGTLPATFDNEEAQVYPISTGAY